MSLSLFHLLFSLPPATIYSCILKAQTPACFDVVVRPPRIVPWGHYSPFLFIVVARTYCRGFLAFAVGSAPEERDTPLEDKVAPSHGVSCDQVQHDDASDLVLVGAGRSFSLWCSSVMISQAGGAIATLCRGA